MVEERLAALATEIASDQLRAMSFAPGSMGPKVEAVCRFTDATNGVASIGDLDDVARVIAGTAGTHVLPSLTAEAAS